MRIWHRLPTRIRPYRPEKQVSGQEASDAPSLMQRALANVPPFRREACGHDTAVFAVPRRRKWMAMLVALICAGTAQSAFAQQMMMGYPPGGPSGYSSVPTQGLPPSFQSHPYISPFDNAFEQHFSSDGLWFRDSMGAAASGAYANEYFFNLTYSRTRYRESKGVVGDDFAALQIFSVLPDDAPGTFPNVLFYDIFSPVRANVPRDPFAHGIRMEGGLRSPLDYQFSWNFNWSPEQTGIYDARGNAEAMRFNIYDATILTASNGVANGQLPGALRGFNQQRIVEEQILGRRVFDAADVETFGSFGTTFDLLNTNLYILNGIPLQNTTDPFSAGADIDGFSQLFDIEFNLRHKIETFGGGAHMTMAPVTQIGGVDIRPLLGGRYMRINEGQFFTGTDSGLNYTFPTTQNGIDDDGDFFIDEIDEGGGALDFTQLNPSAQILVRSFLNSVVRSDLVGPEVGIQYDLGDKLGLNLSGSTRFGLLFNTTKRSIAGDNIGDTATTTIDPITGALILQDMFDTTTLDGPTLNAFADSRTSHHLSPMLEQSLRARFNLFENVPVLRDVRNLQNAQLQLGYTFTLLGGIADPDEQINYISNPRQNLFPSLNTSKSNFWQNTFDVGINWEY